MYLWQTPMTSPLLSMGRWLVSFSFVNSTSCYTTVLTHHVDGFEALEALERAEAAARTPVGKCSRSRGAFSDSKFLNAADMSHV